MDLKLQLPSLGCAMLLISQHEASLCGAGGPVELGKILQGAWDRVVLKARVSAEELLLGAEVLLHSLNRLPVPALRQHLAVQPALLERELLWQAWRK